MCGLLWEDGQFERVHVAKGGGLGLGGQPHVALIIFCSFKSTRTTLLCLVWKYLFLPRSTECVVDLGCFLAVTWWFA